MILQVLSRTQKARPYKIMGGTLCSLLYGGFVKNWHYLNDIYRKLFMSNEKTRCLGYVWDYTQLYGDYNKPLQGSLLNNQDSMESNRFFFPGSYR